MSSSLIYTTELILTQDKMNGFIRACYVINVLYLGLSAIWKRNMGHSRIVKKTPYIGKHAPRLIGESFESKCSTLRFSLIYSVSIMYLVCFCFLMCMCNWRKMVSDINRIIND